MRGFVCLLILALASAPAFAQSVARPKRLAAVATEKSAKDIQEENERAASWLKTCLEDWDAATHMTHKEWQATCNRVTVERKDFLIANPNAFLMKNYGSRPKQ